MQLSMPRFITGSLSRHLDPGWREALRAPLVLVLVGALAVQLVVALATGGARALTPAAGNQPLLDIDPARVTAITIDGDDGQVRLTRGDDGWTLPGLDGFPADAVKVEGLLTTITNLRRPLPVATSAEARARFKVGAEAPEHRLTLSNDAGKLATLLAGGSPGFRRSYVRVAGEDAVYDLPLPGYELSADADDWAARDRLRLDAADIERVSADGWAVIRDGDGWRVEGAAGAPDATAIGGLIGQVANLGYQGVFGTEPPDGADLDSPAMTLDIQLAGGGSRTYRISPIDAGGKGGETDYMLQSSSSPFLYRLSQFDLEGLIDADPSEFTVAAGEPAAEEATAAQPPAAAVTGGEATGPAARAEQPPAAGQPTTGTTPAGLPATGATAGGETGAGAPTAAAPEPPDGQPPSAGTAPAASSASAALPASGESTAPAESGGQGPTTGASPEAPSTTAPVTPGGRQPGQPGLDMEQPAGPTSAPRQSATEQPPAPAAGARPGSPAESAPPSARAPPAGTEPSASLPPARPGAAGPAAAESPTTGTTAAARPSPDQVTQPPQPAQIPYPWLPRHPPPMAPPGGQPPWAPQRPPPGWR